MSLSVTVPEAEVATRDVDNLAKTIIDAFKGLAYRDDAQIASLFITKQAGSEYGFVVGIRRIPADDRGWYVPAHYNDVPYPGQETAAVEQADAPDGRRGGERPGRAARR
jgi:hypothetical protein